MADPSPAARTHAQSEFPAPLPDRDLDRRLRHLPVPLTGFVGRAREVAGLAALLRRPGVRLVTLTGPGGVGKTRLAIRVAEDLAGDFADGAWFVALASVRDPALVAATVAQALGVREAGGRTIADGIREVLRDRRALLVLDNFEHVLDAALLVADLLATCRAITVLATSRAVLRVSGEHVVAVPPLGTSGTDTQLTAAGLLATEAVRLFVARAQSARDDFALTESNAPVVAEICRRLDGLPLAIELAAAQSRLLSPSALLTRLGPKLPLLTGGPRDAPDRLRTMRAAIAWSHDLLAETERVLFRRMAVFVVGGTLGQIEAVADGDGALGSDGLDRLATLVDHSLVSRTDGADGTPRYGMLETIRAFAAERLVESGEQDTLQERHTASFLALAEAAEPAFYTREEPIWFARLEEDQPNLRAALAWAEERGDAETLHRLAAALWWFWRMTGHLAEGRDWLERVRTCPGCATVAPARRAAVLIGLADITLLQDDGDRAEGLLDEGLTAAHAAGSTKMVAEATFFLAQAAQRRGDYDRGEALMTDALGRWRDLGEWAWTTGALVGLGDLARWRGDAHRARDRYGEALDLGERVGFGSGIIWAEEGLGWVALDSGDVASAAPRFTRALALARAKGDDLLVAAAVSGLGSFAHATGQQERAARLLAAADAAMDVLGVVEWSGKRAAQERVRQAVRAALGEEHFAEAWAVGRTLPVEEAAAEAEVVAACVDASPPAPVRRAEPKQALSARELDVLRLLVEGRSDQEIADALAISYRTVTNHVASIRAKLGVSSRTAAAVAAIRHGLV